MQVDLSEIPIMFINISGDYDLTRLKKYADDAKDRIEGLKEITRVDIVGALDREIQINADMNKMQAASVSFSDLERAIAGENVTVSAGTITTFGLKRSIRIAGQFTSPEQIKEIMVKSSSGAIVYVRDIAEVKDSFKEQESFSRINGKNVITLNVIKKSGENLLNASDEIKAILDDMKVNEFPPDLAVNLTGEQSRYTRSTLEELNNTAIIGFILVTLILMFFMGFNNAFFVGLSVPLSMFVAFLIMPGLGFTMNMIVMFAFIFALGIIVDDAIVVIENTHRTHREDPNIVTAAKHAAGEVFLPILSGTLTTLAPFFPLAFWPGIVGKFMHYLPVTLIVTLFASLFVAYIMNPVFAVSFMAHEYEKKEHRTDWKRLLVSSAIMLMIALIFYISGSFGLGNLFVFALILNAVYRLWLKGVTFKFQNVWWPQIMNLYEKNLRFFLRGKNPWYLFAVVVGLFFLSIFLTGASKPKVLFFPANQPNSILVFLKMPEGTDQLVTDSVTRQVETRINHVLGEKNRIVESIVTNVGFGAGNGMFDRSVSSNKGKVTINFVESRYRQGVNTTDYLDQIRDHLKDIPGVQISVEKNQNGPPTGKPVNIEVSGDNLDELILTAANFQNYLDSIRVPGIEKLKSDFDARKPEVTIDIDRERANRQGISIGQVGMELRTAIYGKEVSKYKEAEDEYPIQLCYAEYQRKNINNLINAKITYRDMASGQLRQIPISSVAKIEYKDTYGGINRKNVKRVITISSEVLSGYTANEVVASVTQSLSGFQLPKGITIKLTGEQEDQAETMMFLFKAMFIAVGVIFFILITQFSSLSKSLIILSEVVFSIIGVLLGIFIFGMSISILMTGLGIVALGGIVVRNGILIMEFCDTLRERGM
ncbi:MAG TPA: efflux RND transporter permease subunit, partial [Bacteroidales bacterium]|nr:efflux RND transporter permease subunit [Bacteroidales bacterium]